MSLNDPYEQGAVRAPRLQILNNGTPIGGALSFTVHNNNYYQSDTFTCEFAFNVDPAFGMSFWGDPKWDQTTPLMLDIQASLDGGATFTSLLIGQVDHVAVHIEKGIVSVDGRDRTAVFVDSKTQETFLNLTSSQIVEQLAARHGLQTDIVPTTTLVNRYYEMDHERIGAGQFSRTTTEWNLICSLASHELYDVWVTGNTIHFKPYADLDQNPYLVVWDNATPFSNAMEITIQRSLTFAKDIIVVVRSWDSKTGQSVTKYAPSGARNAAIASGKAEQFSYIFANLGQAEAQAKANAIRGLLTQHERLLEFTRPADLTLTSRNMVQLVGTGSSWDQLYFVDTVSRTMAWDGGFTMTVKAKNASPESSVFAT